MADNDWQSAMAQLNQAMTVAGAQIAAVSTDKLNRDQQKEALKWNQKMQEKQQAFAEEQWSFNRDTTLENNAFNRQMAEDSFAFNKDYQLNKYQYTVQDAQKAGLNPLALGGMNAGSAQVSGGNADLSGSQGSQGAGSGSMPNPILNSFGSIMSAVLANQGSAKVARIEADAQRDIARINASSNRMIADSNIRSQEDIASRSNQNSLYLQALNSASEMRRLLKDIASRENMQVKDLANSRYLENVRLSQQDKEFMTSHLFKVAESHRNFFSDRQLKLLELDLNKISTMNDVDKLIHDRKYDWASFGVKSVLDLLSTAAYFFKPGF